MQFIGGFAGEIDAHQGVDLAHARNSGDPFSARRCMNTSKHKDRNSSFIGHKPKIINSFLKVSAIFRCAGYFALIVSALREWKLPLTINKALTIFGFTSHRCRTRK